ncbi:hypothetical protein GF323_01230 [Candidatus Woesearchaeota archaeon]|nr:hypothetical protein [Candidatus Woesearchaeota archaeon]
MKKSQMEIMGIAIIVVLLSMVLLFAVRFMMAAKDNPVSKEFKDSEMAANFLNTMLETNAPQCSNITFTVLFQDCAENQPGIINCYPDFSCDYIREKTKEMLNATFDVWKIDYYFIAYTDLNDAVNSAIFKPIGSPCNTGRVKHQPLPTKPPLQISLYICD